MLILFILAGTNAIVKFIKLIREEEKEEELHGKIVKRKRFGFRPMSEEEAILQMELLGHNFFIFTSAETDAITVIYKRKDGNYGILEPE